jgi:predicted transcriptional regulator
MRRMLRMPEDVAEAVEILAKRHERTSNAEIVWALRQYITHEDPELSARLEERRKAAGDEEAAR